MEDNKMRDWEIFIAIITLYGACFEELVEFLAKEFYQFDRVSSVNKIDTICSSISKRDS
jgi:hypothetical protein